MPGYYITPVDYESVAAGIASSGSPNTRGIYEAAPTTSAVNDRTNGWIRYTDTLDVPYVVQQRTLVPFVPDPTKTLSELSGVFAGFDFFDSGSPGVITPRAQYDCYEFQLNLQVTPQETRGVLEGELDVQSTLGPITSDSKNIFTDPGTSGRVTLRFLGLALSNFLANGADFYLTCTVPVTITSESLTILPR